MINTTAAANTTPDYVLGHSERELARLKAQALLIDPVTRRFFKEAGVVAGMRVLDVGSGAGDVAFLAADLVGATGVVVGVDRSVGALEEARKRAVERSAHNVTFRVGDPAELDFEQPFDAVIGRYVLQFQNEPAAMLHKLKDRVRPGGLIVFHEIDWGGVGSFPPVPTFDRCGRWGAETLRRHGTESRMGARLHATFQGAGLPPPTMRLEALLGGGEKAAGVVSLVTGVIETLLPEMERLGVATSTEVAIDTLIERIIKEAVATDSIVIGHNQIAAWSRA